MLVEFGLQRGDMTAGLLPTLDGAGEVAVGGVEVSAAVGWDRGSDLGELGVEMPVGDAQWRDAVGEWLVGTDAGEGNVGPMPVEAIPGLFDRLATPAIGVFVVVVGGLLGSEAGEPTVRSGDLTRSLDRRRMPVVAFLLRDRGVVPDRHGSAQ